MIEDRAGKTIPLIFKENGENYFRQLESQILEEVAGRGGRIVSTGGGVPVKEVNRETMKSSGLIVRLSASPEVIHQRLVSSANQRGRTLRPLLGDDAPIEKLRKMLLEREDAYSTANVIVDTESKSHNEVAEAIAEAWRNSGLADSND